MNSSENPRKIIHIDMDCFYAAVEIKDDPSLKGIPLAVGGTSPRGVLTTASYEARKFGVRSAMPTRKALELCKDLILVKPRFERYKEESRHIHEIFKRFTDVIQKISLDEAYLDVTDVEGFSGSATLVAKEIKRVIKEETQLTASAGVAPNKFLAKVASDWRKPDGLMVIPPEKVEEFVIDLPVSKISGVGKVTNKKLRAMGIVTCGDLQKFKQEEWVKKFGKWGMSLYKYARGIDHRKVESGGQRKSLSVERTFFEDKQKLEETMDAIPKLYEEFKSRMEKSKMSHLINGAFIKVKFYDFQTTTHEAKGDFFPGVNTFEELLQTAHKRRNEPVRLIGLGVRFMSDEEYETKMAQLSLFDDE